MEAVSSLPADLREKITKEDFNHYKAIGEKALANPKVWDNFFLRKFKGAVSFFPDNVSSDLDEEDFYGACRTFCVAFVEALTEVGLKARVVRSAGPANNGHTFIELANEDLIIDPTIGQYLKSHKHIFVGTREQLRNLVVTETGEGKQYSLIHVDQQEPLEFFNKTWVT